MKFSYREVLDVLKYHGCWSEYDDEYRGFRCGSPFIGRFVEAAIAIYGGAGYQDVLRCSYRDILGDWYSFIAESCEDSIAAEFEFIANYFGVTIYAEKNFLEYLKTLVIRGCSMIENEGSAFCGPHKIVPSCGFVIGEADVLTVSENGDVGLWEIKTGKVGKGISQVCTLWSKLLLCPRLEFSLPKRIGVIDTRENRKWSVDTGCISQLVPEPVCPLFSKRLCEDAKFLDGSFKYSSDILDFL